MSPFGRVVMIVKYRASFPVSRSTPAVPQSRKGERLTGFLAVIRIAVLRLART